MMKIKPEEFLLDIWTPQGKEGSYFFIATKSVSSGTWKDHPLPWPISKLKIKQFLKKYTTDRYDLYFCSHPFSKPERKKQFVLPTCFAWADLDQSKPETCQPTPQIAWQSSPGRYAALWRTSYFMDKEEAEQLSHTIADAWKADHCWNLTRVLRIPGTKNHKYEGSPKGILLWINDRKYTLEKFNSLQVNTLDAVEVIKKHRKNMPFTTYRLLTASQAEEGKRSDILWKLNHELSQLKLSPSEIYTLLKASIWNKFRGRRDEDEQLKREIEKANDLRKSATLAGLDIEHEVEDDEPICAEGIKPQIVKYLWAPYIPMAKLTIMEGDPGLGKSYLTTKLCHHIANGVSFPGGQKVNKGVAMLFNAEDGLEDTLVPRLLEYNTNMKNVRIKRNDQDFYLGVEGFIKLESYLAKFKPTLVIIDPLVGYLDAELDMNKANHMRSITRKLAVLAEKYGCAILAIRHLTKSSKDNALYRGQGSIDISGAARSVLHVGQDPDDIEGRIICHIKCNIAQLGKAIKYKLVGGSLQPFRWVGECDYTVSDLVSQASMTGVSETEKAKKFIMDYLKKHNPALVKSLVIEGEARGLAESTIKKVKRELKLKIYKSDKGWVWELKND